MQLGRAAQNGVATPETSPYPDLPLDTLPSVSMCIAHYKDGYKTIVSMYPEMLNSYCIVRI